MTTKQYTLNAIERVNARREHHWRLSRAARRLGLWDVATAEAHAATQCFTRQNELYRQLFRVGSLGGV